MGSTKKLFNQLTLINQINKTSRKIYSRYTISHHPWNLLIDKQFNYFWNLYQFHYFLESLPSSSIIFGTLAKQLNHFWNLCQAAQLFLESLPSSSIIFGFFAKQFNYFWNSCQAAQLFLEFLPSSSIFFLEFLPSSF